MLKRLEKSWEITVPWAKASDETSPTWTGGGGGGWVGATDSYFGRGSGRVVYIARE